MLVMVALRARSKNSACQLYTSKQVILYTTLRFCIELLRDLVTHSFTYECIILYRIDLSLLLKVEKVTNADVCVA